MNDDQSHPSNNSNRGPQPTPTPSAIGPFSPPSSTTTTNHNIRPTPSHVSSIAPPHAVPSSLFPMTTKKISSSSQPPSSIQDATDLIEQIIHAAESREASLHDSSAAIYYNSNTKKRQSPAVSSIPEEGGPLTLLELNRLSLIRPDIWNQIAVEQGGDGDGGGGLETIVSLTSMLQIHVGSGVNVDLVGEGREVVKMKEEGGGGPVIGVPQWMQQAKYAGPNSAPLGSLGESKFEPGGGYRRLQILQRALEAASILLGIMSCRGIDRRVVEEDAVEKCVDLIKNHIHRHIIPSLSNTGHLGVSVPGNSINDSEEDEQATVDPVSPKKKKRRTSSISPLRNDICKNMKCIYAPILSTIGLFGTILERANGFVVANEMDDRLLFTLSAAALSTLSIDASSFVRNDTTSLAGIVQVSSMDLLVSIFRRYPRHRSIIIEDLFPLMLQLPTSKRSLRTYLVKKVGGAKAKDGFKPEVPASSTVTIGDHEFIQPICALVLLFIQSCVQMPFQSDNDMIEEGGADDEEEDQGESKDQDKENSNANNSSGLDGCVAVCNQFTAQLLLRCSRKGEEGGASEFRPILHNLIDDLLTVRYQPEFPAAEMLLLYLSSRLGNDLMRASSAPKNAPVEPTYLSTAMDAFGKITSAVASSLLQYRENPFQMLPETLSPSDCEPKEEVNRCFCGRGTIDAFMVDCDRCHSWYHGSCIGITKDTVPDTWFCDDCTLQTAVLEQAEVFARGNNSSAALTSFDHSHGLRQLLLHQVTRAAEISSSSQAESAREFIIATWVKNLTLAKAQPETFTGSFDLDLVRSHVVAQWSRESVEQKQIRRPQVSSDGLDRIMKALVAASSELSSSLAKLVGVLLRLMSDDMASLRKLSVKAILQVVNVDPSLMAKPAVRKEVSRCFHDSSISVREAAVSLVGDYVLQTPSLAPAFHTSLLDRIVDKGVSVRKRIVKIFRDILLTNPTYKGRASAMNCMLQRASDRKEDDNVRDLIFDTFHVLWFDSSSFNMNVANLASETKKTPQAGVKAELYCREAAKQMVEVVKASGSSVDLTCLVKGLLFGFGDNDKDKKVAERKRRQQDARYQCKNLVQALFEILLHFEDTRSNQETDGRELVAIFSTLGVFSQSYPELLVSHIDTLVPYLKGDNGAKKHEAQIVSNISSIISRVAPHFSREDLFRLTNEGLPTDLVNIAYKFPSDAVNAAIEALCKLVNHHHAKPDSIQEKKLHKLALQFYSYLIKTVDTVNGAETKKSIRDNVRRALSALGSICRYYNSEGSDHHIIDPNAFSIVPPNELKFEDNVLSDACFAIFLQYLNKDDATTKCLALRAITGVFISRPRVVLAAEQMGIITDVMSDKAAVGVQVEALKSWRDILLAEEIRIESGEARAKMASQKNITVSSRISGDQDGDSSISGSVLTKHAGRLYEMTLSKDEKVRHMIVDLIGHLLRQGLINPMETVPYLLAMQGDVKSQSTRSLALKLLVNEGEKRPDMLNQRIQAGVKRAFNFQKVVYPQEAENSALGVTALIENRSEGAKIGVETIFDEVIKESSIRNRKAQRQSLYKSIIGMFEKESDHDSSYTKSTVVQKPDTDRLPLLAFAAQILAHLPYNCTADPLFIVYHASSTIALEGNDLLVRFAELLGNDVCDPNAAEDELEKAAKLKSPKKSAYAAKLIKDTNFNTAEFIALCEKASGLNLLLNLKDFLRKAYNLSEARILEYLPSEKERINEKGISIADGTPKFSVSSIFTTGSSDGKYIDWDTAICTYASFRVLMRGDSFSTDADLHFDEGATKKGKKRKHCDAPENSPVLAQVPQEFLSQVSPDE